MDTVAGVRHGLARSSIRTLRRRTTQLSRRRGHTPPMDTATEQKAPCARRSAAAPGSAGLPLDRIATNGLAFLIWNEPNVIDEAGEREARKLNRPLEQGHK